MTPPRYWVSSDSKGGLKPKGLAQERLQVSSIPQALAGCRRPETEGEAGGTRKSVAKR